MTGLPHPQDSLETQTPMRLNPDDVAQYLRDHPEFFDEYAETLAQIYVPHPHGGRAIPIAERQIVTLRDKTRTLETKLRELVQFGQDNDLTIERLHRITLAIMMATDLEGLLTSLYHNLREDFGVPAVALRLWGGARSTRPEFGDISAEVRVFAESLNQPYLSANPMFETASWFEEGAGNLASFAYVALRIEQSFGLLALGSDDPGRFAPDVGTIYVQRLGDIVSVAAARLVPPA